MKIHNALPLISLCVILAVSACQKGEVKDTLGLTKSAPDEFMVLSRPALSVPPSFNLVKPAEKKEYIVSDKVRSDIHSTITGAKPIKKTDKTTGEELLLRKTNIAPNYQIRQILAEEYNVKKQEDESFVGSIRKALTQEDPNVLNPEEEKKRLMEQNKN